MTPERWRQVEDLCHAALARAVEERAAFLARPARATRRCGARSSRCSRRSSSAAEFMSVPAAAVGGVAVLEQRRARCVGQRLGGYTIRSLLGAGGMGEVYRAHDATLGRDVAIKVLPPRSRPTRIGSRASSARRGCSPR